MGEERFSRRFGHRPEEHEIRVREDAPEDVRRAILTIAESDLDLKPSYLREVLCSVLRKLPNRYNWSEYPNVWGECQSLIEDCPWYRVYDFVEALYQHLQKQGNWDQASRWQELINDYFLEAGIGWRMVNGLLESRGPEAFVVAVDTAQNTLQETRLPTARQEIHEALRDRSGSRRSFSRMSIFGSAGLMLNSTDLSQSFARNTERLMLFALMRGTARSPISASRQT
jgi:AbiJ N-terminal domain 4